MCFPWRASCYTAGPIPAKRSGVARQRPGGQGKILSRRDDLLEYGPHRALGGSARLLAGAGRLLRPDGVLVFYGPFMLGGIHTSASNAAFDADLKRPDPRW